MNIEIIVYVQYINKRVFHAVVVVVVVVASSFNRLSADVELGVVGNNKWWLVSIVFVIY